jgi:hypothetical protein
VLLTQQCQQGFIRRYAMYFCNSLDGAVAQKDCSL